ncbi:MULTISPECIES: LacI family DNA-binding transcriptional regulator [unclassified Microbacterium]|uniref:LacI family DNA-binding transcriptional regulator n=1 Tax=unclassified Microbacterium TaxID=2609290 RepID=UPI000AB8640E|nr:MULTISPECIES: LacI family DNA-binding transcriptional regulator [unclassified Microbacterium]MBN9213379.1 LacI family DNA-binding transcriptional regulator [Microbacterium sp.]
MSADSADTAPVRRRRAGSAPTIYDVAKLAGVNPSTVSRALSQPGRINANTEAKIHAAAKELKYRLNPMARALPTGRTNTLGLLIADITNPVIFGIVRGAEKAATANGYTLVVTESQESGEVEATSAERIQPAVDALILGTTRLADSQIVALAEVKPLVAMNRLIDGVACVVPDLEPGVDQALAHLQMLGHTSLLFLAGPAGSWISTRRWEALQRGAAQRGMTITSTGPNQPMLEGGHATLSRVIASDATAIIAYNDLMAIGLLLAATEHGVAVPGRISIVGFDDSFGSNFTSPPLTTVRSPLAEAGELAVMRALELIGGDARRSDSAVEGAALETELIIRGSTGPARTE